MPGLYSHRDCTHQVFIAKIVVLTFPCLSLVLNQKITSIDFTRTHFFAHIIRFVILDMFPF